MKRMKWIAVLLCVIMLLAGCAEATAKPDEGESQSAKTKGTPFDTLSLLDPGKIQSINYTVSGEGGSLTGSTTDRLIITTILEKLTGVQINGMTDKGVDDDDLIIKIVTEQTIIEFAFEGDVLVVGDSRFEVSNLAPLKDYIIELIG